MLQPVEAVITRWHKDPFACGAYAYIPCGGEGKWYRFYSAGTSCSFLSLAEQRLLIVQGLFYSGVLTNFVAISPVLF